MHSFIHLDWDSDFFGFKIARINADAFDEKALNDTLSELKVENYKLAYLSLNPEHISVNEIAIKCGGKLVDEKTTFTFNINNSDIKEYHSNISLYKDNNISKELIDISIQAAEYSRFKTDNLFDSDKYKQLYTEWIIKSVSKQLADDILVYKIKDTIKGLVTVGTDTEKQQPGFIGLVGVDSNERGKGIGIELMNASKFYFQSNGFKQIDVVTQGRNIPACKLYLKSEFYKSKIENLYHFWL